MSDRLAAEFLSQCVVHLRDESLPRITRCLSLLTEEEVWQAPSDGVVSIGHLILHLNGNVRQWVMTGLGGQKDRRQRQEEFETEESYSKAELLARTRATIDEAINVLLMLTESELLRVRDVQAYRESGVAIALHVVEHFSYHVGQISYWTKILRGVDLGFYEGQDLERKDSEN